jgi:hypothetical protein
MIAIFEQHASQLRDRIREMHLETIRCLRRGDQVGADWHNAYACGLSEAMAELGYNPRDSGTQLRLSAWVNL